MKLQNCDAIKVCFNLDNHDKLELICIYRSPNYKISKLNDFINHDLMTLLTNESKSNNRIFLGDLNINLLDGNGETNGKHIEYLNNMSAHGFTQLVKKPTRIEKPSCISIIFSL